MLLSVVQFVRGPAVAVFCSILMLLPLCLNNKHVGMFFHIPRPSDSCPLALPKGEWQSSNEELTKAYVLVATNKSSVLNDSDDISKGNITTNFGLNLIFFSSF